MYVCICHAVTDTEVKAVIEDGATTCEAVTRACRAGGDCGACIATIAQMIDEHVECASEPPEKSGPLLAPARLLRDRERAA